MSLIILQMGEERQEPERQPTGIYKAIAEGNLEQVQQFLKMGINLGQKNRQRCKPLILAVDLGYREIVRVLLEAGALPIDREGYLLEKAIEENKTEILSLLIKAGLDVNQKLTEDDKTALMDVAGRGDINAVKLLVEAGADVNAISNCNDYALLNAACSGWQETYDYLYPLTAVELRKEAEEQLSAGLRRRQRLDDKFTENFISAAAMGDIRAVLAALEDGVNINAFNADEHTALSMAAYWGHLTVVRALIEAGVNLNLGCEYDGETPLISAASMTAMANSKISVGGMNQAEVARLLIEAGADVNAGTDEGWTALMAAANAGSIEVVKLLLQAGADVNAKDGRKDTALSRAQKTKHQEIVELLKEAGTTE